MEEEEEVRNSASARAAPRSEIVRLVPDCMFARVRAAAMDSLLEGWVVVVLLVGGEGEEEEEGVAVMEGAMVWISILWSGFVLLLVVGGD